MPRPLCPMRSRGAAPAAWFAAARTLARRSAANPSRRTWMEFGQEVIVCIHRQRAQRSFCPLRKVPDSGGSRPGTGHCETNPDTGDTVSDSADKYRNFRWALCRSIQKAPRVCARGREVAYTRQRAAVTRYDNRPPPCEAINIQYSVLRMPPQKILVRGMPDVPPRQGACVRAVCCGRAVHRLHRGGPGRRITRRVDCLWSTTWSAPVLAA